MHPLQDVASQELHCWMTNEQTQANLFLFPWGTTYKWGGVGPKGAGMMNQPAAPLLCNLPVGKGSIASLAFATF